MREREPERARERARERERERERHSDGDAEILLYSMVALQAYLMDKLRHNPVSKFLLHLHVAPKLFFG